MEETRTRLRRFVAELLEDQGADATFRDDATLISSGVLDSLAVVQIVVFMEKEFGLDFSVLFFDQTTFDSVDEMLRFIQEGSKAGGGEPAGDHS